MTDRAPVDGWRAWLAGGLVVVAVLTGVWTLRPLVAPGPWLPVSALLVVGLGVLTAALRRAQRSRTAPSAVAALVAAFALGSVYAGTGTTPTLFLPTPDSLDRLVRLVRSGVDAIAEGFVPVEPTRGIELLIVTGAVVVFLAADLVAIGLGRAGLSGVFLAALWAVSAVFERNLSFPVLLLGGTSYLLLLAVVRPAAARRSTQDVADAATALVTACVVTVLAVASGPALAAMPFYGAVRLPSTWGGPAVDGPLRLSTDLDMRSSLGRRSDRTIMTYTTDDVRGLGPLRMYTVWDFDGREWQRGEPGEDLTDVDGLLWPTDVPASPPVAEDPSEAEADADEAMLVDVRIGDLDQDRLPIALDPREVTVDGGWRYDPQRDEILAPRESTSGLRYVMSVAPRDLSPETLRADGPGTRYAADSPVLAVPASPFEAEIRSLAEELTAGATTPFDQAMALQTYFRSMENFEYSAEVPPAQSEDAVWDFLTERTGYCVQFATAMTVMSRTLGIPSRLAIGFLPGRASPDVRGEFVVSGRQAHAWPELYFADAGWVRFEPTPATQTGAPPAYADPNAGLPLTQEEIESQSPAAAESPEPTIDDTAEQGGGGQVTIGSTDVPVRVLGGVTVAVLLVLAAVVARYRRRTAAAERPTDADEWWAVLRGRLATYGIAWGDATTPRQAADLLRERYASAAVTGTVAEDVALDASHALALLVAAVESERYAPAPGAVGSDDLERWVGAVERPFAVVRADGPQERRPSRSTIG